MRDIEAIFERLEIEKEEAAKAMGFAATTHFRFVLTS